MNDNTRVGTSWKKLIEHGAKDTVAEMSFEASCDEQLSVRRPSSAAAQ